MQSENQKNYSLINKYLILKKNDVAISCKKNWDLIRVNIPSLILKYLDNLFFKYIQCYNAQTN